LLFYGLARLNVIPHWNRLVALHKPLDRTVPSRATRECKIMEVAKMAHEPAQDENGERTVASSGGARQVFGI
jgi:hypothetical protein